MTTASRTNMGSVSRTLADRGVVFDLCLSFVLSYVSAFVFFRAVQVIAY